MRRLIKLIRVKKMKRTHSTAALLLCFLLAFTGCKSNFQGDGTLLSGTLNEECVGDGSFLDAGKLTAAQQQAVLDYENAYFTSIGNLDVQIPNRLFCNEEQKDYENAVWSTITAVRESALEDLRLESYSFSLTVTESYPTDEGVIVTIIEENTQQFRALSVLSEQFNIIHDFTLKANSDGSFSVKKHDCDSGAFYSFAYSEETKQCAELDEMLAHVEERHASLGVTTPESVPKYSNAYDRDAAVNYALSWVGKRNGDWPDYTDYGGNCMNYASQMLYSGGVPMDGDWYWNYINGDVSPAWCNVVYFYDYALENTGSLVCNAEAPYYTGEPGDILIMGISTFTRHATEICGIVTDESGNTVDYLLCSNTDELKNFPAGAYCLTNQKLIKIYGSN